MPQDVVTTALRRDRSDRPPVSSSGASAALRVGVDACCWANGRGYGRFTRELLRTMVTLSPVDEFTCFVDPWTLERFDLRSPNVKVVCVAQSVAPTLAASATSYRSPLDMLRLTKAVARERLDVFFSPSAYTYFPLPPRLAAVVTIHDAIAERFPQLTFSSRQARWFWHAKVRLAVWQARLILTISDFSATELASILKIPPARIRVTSEAPAAEYRPSDTLEQIESAAREFGVPTGARWMIYVGGFNPHKHVDIIVRAHAEVVRNLESPPLYLLLVGSIEDDVFYKQLSSIKEAVSAAGTSDLVKWTGRVPDQQLRHLLSGAVALLLPSACEGFGLPAVEAAACGTPVIATTASPLPKLLEGGGIFIAPGDQDALIDAMRLLCAEPERRKILGANARRQASRLSWPDSARIAMEALREAAR